MTTAPTYPVKKLIRMSTEMAYKIADMRFAGRYKSETEAVREIIRAGLKALRVGDR